jgi:prepilin-type N-terminal cleavage/methylation domain-containing protein
VGLDFAVPPASQEDPLPARSRLRKGFTLIELMTAVAIIAVLASLAVTVMVYGTGKARMNNTVFDLAALLNTAQLSAMSRGSTHYVILYRDPSGQIQAVLMERPDAPPDIDWNNLDLSHVPGTPGNPLSGQEGPYNSPSLFFQREDAVGVMQMVPPLELDRLKMAMASGPDSGGVAFLDLDSSRVDKPLPAPFNTIPMTTLATPTNPDLPTTDLLAGCSFCVEAAGVPYGAIRFNSDGTVEIATGDPNAGGGVIAFMPNTTDEQGFQPKLLTISAPAGAVHTF